MKINTYPSLREANGEYNSNLRVLSIPFEEILEDGSFEIYSASAAACVDVPCIVLIIDENTMNQLKKLKVIHENGIYSLYLKDGETFDLPVETQKEKDIRELEEQLKKLKEG